MLFTQILDPLIVSGEYWPQLQNEVLNIPKSIQDLSNDYSVCFTRTKAMREIIWEPSIGHVELEILANGETLTFTASPVQACILLLFSESGTFNLIL